MSGNSSYQSQARGTWASFRMQLNYFEMDLGDPDDRAAFMSGEIPSNWDLAIRLADRRELMSIAVAVYQLAEEEQNSHLHKI